MWKLHNEFLGLDEMIPYDEAELEDLNQFNCVMKMEEDIKGLFKLPNILVGLRPALEGFVVTMHEGACETGSQIPTA